MNAINLANVPPTPRLDEYFGLWAVDETRFCAMFDRISRMNLQLHVQETERPELESKMYTTPARGGATQSDAGQIAVITLAGTMMKQAGSLDSGASTVAARRDIRNAANDPNITGIMLLIDSPGGTVAGTADLASDVSAANAKKPVYAFVEDLCASAAYWVASATSKIYANGPTALVGSIGTYAGLYDLSGAAAKDGIKAKLYKTGPLKGAGFPGTEITAEQDAAFQKMVDEMQTHFSGAVKSNRKLSDEQMKNVSSGGVFLATEAQSLGLIDGIKSFDETLAALEAAATKKKPAGARASAEVVPSKQEIAMSDPTKETAAAIPAASLKELKTALPKASADFLVKAQEDGLTVSAAKDRYMAEQDAAIDDLRAKQKTVGTKPIGGGAKGGTEATAGDPITDFKAIVDGHISAGMKREKAWSKAVHENKELHAAYVTAYNEQHGRKGR
jgi:signal peptide peptidase SppA